MKIKTGIGQDSHRFIDNQEKKCILGGIVFDDTPALQGNSDSDVILHAIVNALTGIHGEIILGKVTDQMCKDGIIDSEKYILKSLEHMNGFTISNVSISVECLRPKISPKSDAIRENIARILNIDMEDISITATTGEGLTDFGKGLGVQAFVVITATK